MVSPTHNELLPGGTPAPDADKNAVGGMRLHHIGCAVASLEKALSPFVEQMEFSRISRTWEIQSQQVRVCFVETAPGIYMELVEGTSGDSPVSGYVKRRQFYYHVCYSVANVPAVIERLKKCRFRCLSIFESEAFAAKCAFLSTPESALIELCQEGTFRFP